MKDMFKMRIYSTIMIIGIIIVVLISCTSFVSCGRVDDISAIRSSTDIRAEQYHYLDNEAIALAESATDTGLNTEGYYYKPRLFLDDLLKIGKDEIYITTACVAGLLKDSDSYNEIFLPLVEHFGKNVFLEVQNHNFDIQKEINEKAIWCQVRYGLELIAANDSHYIYPEQSIERLELLKGKGITYDDEDSFVLDYPDYDTMVERFITQGILSEEQIIKAIDNTLIFDEIENIDINTDIKMPTIYPNKTDEEKYQILVDYLNDNFDKVMDRDNIPLNKRNEYIEECKKIRMDRFKIIYY